MPKTGEKRVKVEAYQRHYFFVGFAFEVWGEEKGWQSDASIPARYQQISFGVHSPYTCTPGVGDLREKARDKVKSEIDRLHQAYPDIPLRFSSSLNEAEKQFFRECGLNEE